MKTFYFLNSLSIKSVILILILLGITKMGFTQIQNPTQNRFVKNEVLVKFKKNITTLKEVQEILDRKVKDKLKIKKIFSSLSKRSNQLYVLLNAENNRLTTETIIKLLQHIDEIENVQPNYILRFPADPKTKLSKKVSADSEDEYVVSILQGSFKKPKRKTVNPTAPNDQTSYLRGDFTDTDGDGMTNVAEIKYGYDPNNASSFPVEQSLVVTPTSEISNTGIGAKYEVGFDTITIRWTNPANGSYSLSLYNGVQTIYYGGHSSDYAVVSYSVYGLNGTETLNGHFTEYNANGQWVQNFPDFTIDLSTISPLVLGTVGNKISYTFQGFPSTQESLYKEFLKRVFPLMYEFLGPPAESFNCVITNMGEDSSYFMVTNGGRTFLSDTDFVPRLIVHEFVHAWKGNYAFTSDANWDYDSDLSGFEEGTAEGIAFNIIHEYVRSYPNDSASLQLLDWKPYQYWSSRTTSYDLIKHERWTGAGSFWTHTGGQVSRYSIAATTFQIMLKENPNAYKDILTNYFNTINNDHSWRPNRTDILNFWGAAVPLINGIDTITYINTLPVFQGKPLDEGIYILATIRHYGLSGDQQFASSYVTMNGDVYWGIPKDSIASYNIPSWIKYDPGDDIYYYMDTQGQPFQVDIIDSYNQTYGTYQSSTGNERRSDGTANGFGWQTFDDIAMEKIPLGFYRERVTFTNYFSHDAGARENFLMFGYDDFTQNILDYVVMIGIDGIRIGTNQITLNGETVTKEITEGAAIFSSSNWPLDMEEKFPIVVTDTNGNSHTYYRTILEAGTIHSYYQHQFAIIDNNFDGIEESISVIETPVDKPGYTLSEISGITTNDWTTANFTVKLTKAPTATVTVSISNSDSSQVSLLTTSLTFTTTNWNTPQSVSVKRLRSNGLVTITLKASSADPAYNSIRSEKKIIPNYSVPTLGTMGLLSLILLINYFVFRMDKNKKI